jgi:surfeit locus 1 family protein
VAVSVAETGRSRPGLLVPCVTAFVMLAVLIALGTWQLQRKAWKEALIAALDSRLAAAAVPLPPAERWAGLDQSRDEFRRVIIPVTLPPDEEALVYGANSARGGDVSVQGYWVFAPAKLADGATVVVNRGFIPANKRDPQTHRVGTGSMNLTGILRWPEPRNWFSPADNPADNLWFVRDHLAMAAAKGWGPVAPFYIDLETASGPDDLPKAGSVRPTLRNEHLQYAITWYGLAAVLVVVFLVWIRANLRQRRTVSAAPDPAPPNHESPSASD